MSPRRIELLAPARDKQTALAAIAYGADAVYIGASRFGARAAAGNSLADIEALCREAHRYGARVYVTVNTCVYDDELAETKQLIDALSTIGVDALLLQDMALLQYARGKIELHASTQTDCRTAAQAAWLSQEGFSRVVLAREMSVEEIATVHRSHPYIELEAFVHGALCVSYSGQCYASEHTFQRSANRGECAQMCRMEYDLVNSDGETIVERQHLLSLKDMCRIDSLEEMLRAGVTSLKIEGRLKDVGYVKNIVSAYRRRLDDIIRRNPKAYCHASLGSPVSDFTPNVKKSFNRGFTDYFLHSRTPNIIQPYTPKSIGEPLGTVDEVSKKWVSLKTQAAVNNGDGLCFFADDNRLTGFRINRVDGNRLFPLTMPPMLRPGTAVYRNLDHAFQSRLQRPPTGKRQIPISLILTLDNRICLTMTVKEWQIEAEEEIENHFDTAVKPQKENILRQLGRLGDTVFCAATIDVSPELDRLFIPSSLLAHMRRTCVERLQQAIIDHVCAYRRINPTPPTPPDGTLATPQSARNEYYFARAYLYNIYNREAQQFYAERGLAAETRQNQELDLLMQCRHCLRYHFGECRKNHNPSASPIDSRLWKEPVSLRLASGKMFPLEFDCKNCQMNLYATKKK